MLSTKRHNAFAVICLLLLFCYVSCFVLVTIVIMKDEGKNNKGMEDKDNITVVYTRRSLAFVNINTAGIICIAR